VSDLQCPARIHLVREDRLEAGVRLAARERIAHVYGTSEAAAAEAAEAAAILGVRSSVLDVAGDTSGEHLLVALDDVADRHRGEAVLVVVDDAAIVATLAALALGPGGPRDDEASALLERDADGWRLGEATLTGG
jgi:hypothetical protein